MPAEIESYLDKQTGTNTDREGYGELMTAIEGGEISQVITSEVSPISRSVRDFSAPVERIVDENRVGLHILDMGIALNPNDSDPYTRAFVTVAATFAELEAEIKRENVRKWIAAAREHGKWHGLHRSGLMSARRGIPFSTTTTKRLSSPLMNSTKAQASAH